MNRQEVTEARRAQLQPIHAIDESLLSSAGEALTYGWWAMRTVPAIGDEVKVPGVDAPLLVVCRRWEQTDIPYGAMTIKEAGLSVLDAGAQWLAVLTLRGDAIDADWDPTIDDGEDPIAEDGDR